MKRTYTLLSIMLFLSIAFILSGCEETTSGGSGAIDIGRAEPKIIDSMLAVSVVDDRPSDITDTFDSELDDKVFLWILWDNIDTGHQVEVNWISPDDDLEDPPYHSEKITISSTTGDKITWFYIDAPTGGLSGEKFASGYWIVEIYLDDLFERGHLFYME